MRRFAKGVLATILVIACAVLAVKGSVLVLQSGSWSQTGILSNPRVGASAATLPDGRILIAGGDPGNGPTASVDLFNTDGTISAAPPMMYARSKQVSVALQDGRILVAGGVTTGGSATNTAEIFDPIAQSWSSVALGMIEARSGATAAVLQDGRVLVAGGQNGTAISSTLEIFDPVANAFSAAGMMSSPRSQHAMAVLQDGRVLIVGGNNGTAPVASTSIFDPVAGTVSAGPALNMARYGHSATTLLNGMVVVIGGNNGNAITAQMDVTPAELFDPAAGTFTTLATNLTTLREGHLAILLPNNNSVLIAGGTSGGTAVASAELFTPQESTQAVWTYGFGPTGSMTAPRSGAAGSANQFNVPSTTMRRNGIVAVAGGSDANGNALNTAEAYGYPTVQTDQSDYPPGTTVTITGSGFQAGEAVTIQLVESPVFDTHGPYTVQADANGNISDNSFVTDSHDLNIRFYLTATGQTSGFQAQNTFTDASSAKNGDGTMAVSPTTLFAASTGNTLTFTFTSPSGGDFNANSQATIQVPVGWTPPTSSNVSVATGPSPNCPAATLGTITGTGPWTIPINMTCPAKDQFTVTYNVGTAPAAGTYTFTTQTKQNGGTLTAIEASPTVTVNNPSPTLTSISPNSGDLGQTISTVTLTGTGFLTGITTVSFGSNITVNSTTVNSGTQITANIIIATNATTGARNVTVTNPTPGGGTGTLTNGFTVNNRTTPTGVTLSLGSVVVGQTSNATVTVTDTDSGTQTNPTGTVTLSSSDSGDTFGTCSLASSGGNAATCTASVTPSKVGTSPHTITATFPADTTHATSSGTASLTVNQASTMTTVALTTGTNPSVFGQSLTFTATVAAVAPGAGAPTGNVTFKDGAATLATVSLTGNTAALTTTTLAVGGHSITATYNADANFTGSTSTPALSQTVNQDSTTTTITAHTPSPSVVGQTVSITFTVAANPPGSGAPTGNVTVSDGAGDTCSASVAIGTCSITFTTAGPKSLTASYPGDTNFTISTSTPATSHTVNAASTSTTITNAASLTSNPTVVGQAYAVNYSVAVSAPGSGTIPGTDTVTVSDGSQTCTATVAASTCNLTSTTVGSPKTITATFNTGDPNFATSTSTSVSHTVNKRATTTSVILSLGTVVVGQASSATVTVTDTDAGTQTNPTGTMTLSSSDAGDTFGACTLVPSGTNAATCTASVTPSKVGTSPHTITASFPPDTTHATSSGTASLAVNQANTTTTITSNTPNPSTVGQSVTINYSVTVNSPGAGTPTGTVTVSDVAGDSCIGTVAAGTCSITFNTAGTKTLTATYAGDTSFNTSASTGTSQTVNPKLAFTTSAFAILTGTCSSQVSVQTQNANGSAANQTPGITLNLSSSTPTGKFFSDAACMNQVTSVSIASGASTASFFYADSTIGSPVITVASSGLTSVSQTETITGLRFGTGAFSVQVNTCSSAITLQSAGQSGGPTSLTQATTINLSSTSMGGKFYTDAACTTLITSTTISPAIDAGHDSNNFYYKDTSAGGPTLTGSVGTASATQTETVSKANTTTTVASSGSPTVFGQGVTFTATLTVNSPGSGTPTGTVTFYDGGTSIGTGSLSVVGGNDVATLATSTLSVGNHTITAAYTIGDSNFNASAMSSSITQVVNKSSTTTTVASSGSPIVFGQSDTFTAIVAAVTPGAGTPSGPVTFYDGGTSIGTGTLNQLSPDQATFTTTTLTVGSHMITAEYKISDGNFNASAMSSAIMQTITGTPPQITSVASVTFNAGMAGSFTVIASGTPTPSLNDGGAKLPAGITFTDNGNGTATLAGTTTVAGATQFTITASNGVQPNATQPFTLTILAGAPASISVFSGSGQSATVNTAFTNPLVALAQDIFGNPVPSVSVTFTAPASGASGTFANGTSTDTEMTNAGGMATSSTFTANTTASSYSVSASTPSVTGAATFSLTNNPASPTKLVITSNAFTIIAGQCSGTMTVTSEDQYNNTSKVSNPVQVDLSSASATGKFYSDAGCQTLIPVIPANTGKTSVSIASNSSSQTFAYADTTPSPLPNSTTTITAADDAGTLTSGTQNETILQLMFTTASFTTTQSTCSGPITLTAENAKGTPTNVTVAATLGLTSTSSGPTFYSDTACSTAITPSGTPPASDVTIGSGASAVSFSYEDSAAGNPTITATVGGYFLTQQEQIGTPPKVTSNPISVNITYGSNATFSAAASGTPTPTVQWQVSTDGSAWNNLSNGGVYSGATATTLTLTLPPVSLTGTQYRAVFTNAAGTANTGGAVLTINPEPLTVSIIGNPTKTFDGTATATLTSANFSINGLVSPDSFTVTQTVGTYATPNAGMGIGVTASLSASNFTPSGATIAGNYSFPNSASGTGTISPKAVTASITASDKNYDGTNTAAITSCTIPGKVGSDDVACSVPAGDATFASSNASSTAQTVTATGITLTGAAAGNYVLVARRRR